MLSARSGGASYMRINFKYIQFLLKYVAMNLRQ